MESMRILSPEAQTIFSRFSQTRVRKRNVMTRHRTSDGMAILDSITGRDPKMIKLLEEEAEKLRVAKAVYEFRTNAGVSQTDLAKRIGTTKSVISRLEDAD